MAKSSIGIMSSDSSISAPNSSRYWPSPTNSCNVSFSFTASTSHTDVRAPPASPFYSDHAHSWREEISWQIEPNEPLNYPKTLGSALSPWGWSSPPTGLSQTFRRTPNDYHLPRTYENGKLELRSYASSDCEIGRRSALGEEDMVSIKRYNSEVDFEVLNGRNDDGGSYYCESDYDEKVKKKVSKRRVGLMGLFRYSTKWDLVLVMVGCVGAIMNGGSLHCYSYLFGQLVTNIASEAFAGHKTQMLKGVQQVTHPTFHSLEAGGL